MLSTETCVQRKPTPRPKNRAPDFFDVPETRVRVNPAPPIYPHQETFTASTTTVSGVVYWLSKDPIGISGGLNQYVFVGNNPVNFVDPSGLCAEETLSTGQKTIVLAYLAYLGAKFLDDANQGSDDFIRNYIDMRRANTIGADKYFHAKANYEAASRGAGGKFFAEHFSNAREVWDQNVKGYPRSDSIADQEANAHGRSQVGIATNGQEAAAPYRPNGLDPQY